MADQAKQCKWDTVPEYVRTGEEGAVETLDSEVTIIQDLSEAENSPIECALPSPSANVTEPHVSDVHIPSASTSIVVPAVESDIKEAPPKLNPRRSFTTEFKLECVLHAEKTQNKTKTAREFNVNRRRVQEWCTQKEKLMAIPKQQKRLSGVHRRQSGCDVFLKDEKPAESDTANGKVDIGLTSMTCAPQEEVSVIGLEKATGDAPEVLTVQSIDRMTSDTIIDSIVRGLPLDLSIIPPNMIKILQDLSAEVLSHEARASIESMIRDTSMEMLIQKGVDTSSTRKPTDVGESDSSRGSQATVPGPQSQGTLLGPSVQQDSAGNKADASAGSGDGNGPDAAAVEADTMDPSDTQQQQISEDAPLTDAAHEAPMGPPVDTTVQAAILEALMQVASTVQMSPADLLQSLHGPASAIVNQQSSEQNLVPAAEETVVAMEPEEVKENIVISNKVPSFTAQQQQQQQQQGLSMSDSPGRGISVSSGDTSGARTSAVALPVLRTKIKRFYTVEFKLECIAYAESASKCAAARKFHVDRRRVQDWCSQKEKLQQLKSMSDGDKKPVETELIEKQLAAWVKEQLEGGKSLTRKMVGDEAVQLFRESGNALFNAGTGWVAKFMIRNNISLVGCSRQATPAGIADVLPEIVEIDGSGNT